MVPLRDENPTTITPLVTYAIIIINILAFIFEIHLQQQGQLEAFFQAWAVVPQQFTANPQGEWITLFSSQFLHGGWLHLGGNMLFLWIFGNNVEDCLGHIKYLLFYLICGALAALAQWFFSMDSAIPSLGASGAIAGVMGAYIIKYPTAKIVTLIPLYFMITTVRIPAFIFLGIWFIQQAFYSLASLPQTSISAPDGIAYWAHAGGFIFGAILGPLMGLFRDDR